MIYTTQMLKEKYSSYVNPLDKIRRDSAEGKIFRLTRGLYETDKHADPVFLAAPILSPSYVSFDYALSYYGLIPERVVAVTSASFMVRKNKTFNNYFGRFEFSDIPPAAYPYGITIIESGDYYACKIATREKAICDSLYKWPPVKSVKDLKELMFEDKRIDEEEFSLCNFNDLVEIAALYKKSNLNLLIKLVRKEYMNE